MTSMETHILAVAQQFAREVLRIESLKEGTGATVSLSIKAPSRYETDKKPKLQLECSFYDGRNHSTVTAASLGALMDEVHRRCGFADRQGVANDVNEAALVALEPPKDRDLADNDIPF
jgi:hypothetical protein